MKVPCKLIAEDIKAKTLERLKAVYKRATPPKVALFYIGNDPLINIFIERKKQVAKEYNIQFEVFRYEKTPLFQNFATDVRKIANNKQFHGIIIQRPIPASLTSPTLENFIPLVKEIEGQRHKSPYISPIGLSTLSILKYIDTNYSKWQIRRGDSEYFKRNFKKLFIVLAGRGKTTGQPIAQTLVNHKLAMVITHSKTPEPDQFYRQADIIITTTGQPIIKPDNIKQGVILINYGYRREEEKTFGDYVESDIESIASHYTPVINGTGLVMLAYLMRNVVEAYAKQVK